ncbi:hypothetical protein O7034_004679 [Escherichia coli]|uniref:hypothetical protein n=1 Tax=Escherichia coli TaxID=562 RepID=UPI00063D14C3|nr:hypothetical protein [Escherichia coli]EFF5412675.1 hypothetical protein [Escherichia coli]EIG9434261.1 hypothetical protein [Escherichia coli]EKC4045291.1 hypothetical protein [Escherichia coli]EKH3656129.1 hypothetical protein [Escherichia coli]EKH3761107.1 hypothetical protein [Escherichia coli]
MANQNKINVFQVESKHKTPVINHVRRLTRLYTPEEFIAMPMIKKFIRDNPGHVAIDKNNGEIMLSRELAEIYCNVNNGKKLKKTIRKISERS